MTAPTCSATHTATYADLADLARGPRSAFVLTHLQRPAHDVGVPPPAADDALSGEDSPLALHLLYELHYRGLPGCDVDWEWNPSLLAARAQFEAEFAAALRDRVGPIPTALSADQVAAELDALARGDGPSLSSWMRDHGELVHLREFAMHRSIYQLKEADPHTFGIPRLTGQAKAALVEIQRGEYGDGQPGDVHATLFAETLRLLGLDDRYGAYLDSVPGVTLTTGNLISFFGLHRRWRGALVGHLALFEMCSVAPMRRYAETTRRLGLPERAAHFYDVHVAADAHHSVVGRDQLARGLVTEEPSLAGDVVFGAKALSAVESAFAHHLIHRWSQGRTSLLRAPAPRG